MFRQFKKIDALFLSGAIIVIVGIFLLWRKKKKAQ
jgi:LPXTG-motif cell wall-anchored protein